MADATLHGELSQDGTWIVLLAAGLDHQVMRTATTLRTLTPLIKPSDPPGALVVPATWAAVVQLAHTFGQRWVPGPRLRAWIAEAMAARTAAPETISVNLPEGCVPRPYQVDGALMIGALGRVMIFDDPGTGKTITTIVGLLERAQHAEVRPVVCVVPNSVVDAWVTAWQVWAPHWRAVAWRGLARKRRALAGGADVYVVGYDTARNDAADREGALVKLGPGAVVVDECHMIKNQHAMRSLAARRLARRAEAFVALSGTPITHAPDDLWPTLEGLAPLAWPSRRRFVDRYCLTDQGDYGERVLGLARATEPEFRASLLGQYRRVSKADVLAQLPPKVYSVRRVELPRAWRQVYDQMEADMLAELPDGEELGVMSALALLTRLSQLASSAADVTTSTDEDDRQHVQVRLKAPSWKVDELLAILAERPGEPVVVFAPSRQLMMLAGQAAEAAGYSVGYVVGAQNAAERTDNVDTFQAGKHDLLCATTGAGGVGLTLTAARTVVFLQRPWSLVDSVQAEDRCHRIGSEIHDSIEVIDIVAADTVDTRVREVLHEKAGQLSDLLQDPRIAAELLGGRKEKQ